MEIGSASYFLMMLLTICVAVAGIFGPQSIEKSSNHVSCDQLNKRHCRIFGNCIFFGGIFLLGGLLDVVGTIGMIVAGEVLLFGAMYFIGLLANESDKARVVREKQRAEQARAHAERENARRLEWQRRFDLLCELALVAYMHNVDRSLSLFAVLSYDENPAYDEHFMRDIEGNYMSPEDTLHWRILVLFAWQNPQLDSSQACLKLASDMIKRCVEKHLAARVKVQ